LAGRDLGFMILASEPLGKLPHIPKNSFVGPIQWYCERQVRITGNRRLRWQLTARRRRLAMVVFVRHPCAVPKLVDAWSDQTRCAASCRGLVPRRKMPQHSCSVKENRRCNFVPPNSVSSRPPHMIKHRLSSRKGGGGEQQFEDLLTAMGMDKANPFSRSALTQDLRGIESAFTRAVAVSGKQPDRDVVKQYSKAIAKLQTLSGKIGPDFFSNEIEKAGWSRHNPHLDDSMLRAVMDDHRHEREDVVAVLTAHRLDIDHWLKTTGADYKKRQLSKLVVEPFLDLMVEYEITTSRKQLPRKRMFDALFDWLGVDRNSLTSKAIDAAAKRPRSKP
jgi:hypothetical protein